jgi:hypothetical protein
MIKAINTTAAQLIEIEAGVVYSFQKAPPCPGTANLSESRLASAAYNPSVSSLH